MPSEQPDLWLNIQEPHDAKIEKAIKNTDAKRAKNLFDFLVEISKIIQKDRVAIRKLRKAFEEVEILIKKFVKNKHLTASFKLKSKFDEIANLITTSSDLSGTVQTHKIVENYVSKLNKF